MRFVEHIDAGLILRTAKVSLPLHVEELSENALRAFSTHIHSISTLGIFSSKLKYYIENNFI